jgi:chorismate mutase/prephenate dehydratase
MMADATAPTDELLALRERIDAVDRELLSLLNRRAGLALAVGDLKKREGSVVFRPEREAQVIDGLKAANPGPLRADSVAPIWREIMSACRALESPTRVAFLGPAGTFSEEAALGFFGSSIVRVPCASFDEVFRVTAAGAADFGVVPVENSPKAASPGARPVPAHAAVHHRRDQPLRAPQPAARTDVAAGHRGGLAHPQALAQCHGWLSTTCRRSSAGRCRATPKAPGWPAWTSALAGIASARRQRVRPARGGRGDPGRRPQPHPLRHRDHPDAPPGAQGQRARLHQPRGVGDQPPGAVHDLLVPLKNHGVSMTASSRARRARASGSTTSTSTSRATPTSPRGRRAGGAARRPAPSSRCWAPTPVDVH